jgi:Rrf2 family transcriptional regulator, iron-sulfur cluster assembly transcription factor
MSFFSRAQLSAIAAVVDIAINERHGLVTESAIASRQQIPQRHLEPILQALAHVGILKGRYGGYELAREASRISVFEIVQALDDPGDRPLSLIESELVIPALREAETALAAALKRLSVHELTRAAPDGGHGD